MSDPWQPTPDRLNAAAQPSTVDTPPVAGPYTELTPHARGGLGEVLRATDPGLHRTVAVKRLLDRRADDSASRARFLQEAEITARLEHPGVVPVYGLFHDGGRPCYAMRFVQGQTVDEAMTAYHAGPPDPLAFRRLLQSFQQVCQTVAYTHNRGVIHRDLKPSNVMLGRFGETLVVDWGLAKAVGRTDEVRAVSPDATLQPTGGSSTDTELGAAVGTPAYMSPEQAAGRWDVVGPASDVYGLGAVLYTLLTGRAPLEKGNWPEMQQKIQRGDFPRPRQLKPGVPRTLEAVCLKAMALEPHDRYASAEALAADVEHWLADEPVTAYREPAATRLFRWGRRHRPLVAGAAALLLTAVAALGVGMVLLGQAGARTEQQRQLAEANFAEAERQRDLARANFEMARRAVDDYFVQVSENTLLKTPQPGLQPLRKQLLESALKYYQEFVRQSGDDPKLKAELAQAYFRVGALTGEIGRKDDALDALLRARDLYQALSQADPQNASYRGDLARTWRFIGKVEAETGKVADASKSFQQAIILGEELVPSNPEVPEFQRDLALSYNNLAVMHVWGGQPAAAIRSYGQAISTFERLIRVHPRAEFQMGLGLAYSNLGEVLTHAGRLTEAANVLGQAIDLNQEAMRANRKSPDIQNRLAMSLGALGRLYFFTGQNDKALRAYQQALDVAEPLTHDNPEVSEYKERLILYHIGLAAVLLATGQDAEGRHSLEVALELGKTLPEGTPRWFSYASIHRSLGKLLRRQGQTTAALDALKRAAHIGETDPGGEKPQTTYELACACALCSAVVGEGKAELTSAEQEAKENYAKQAMEALRHAVAEGWENVPWMKIDPDLDALRARADFQQLLTELEKNQER
jgi:serine/threonine-protein kinase